MFIRYTNSIIQKIYEYSKIIPLQIWDTINYYLLLLYENNVCKAPFLLLYEKVKLTVISYFFMKQNP